MAAGTGDDRAPNATRAALAGTVVVIREQSDGPAALMVRRLGTLRFMGGAWVFPGGAADAHELAVADRVAAAALAASRELREEVALHIAPAALHYWAHWITPSSYPRRFDARFFLARAPADQQPALNLAEADAIAWHPLADWARLGVGPMAPVPGPTKFVLREIAEALVQAGSVANLIALAAARRILPVLPKMPARDVVLYPWDDGYAGAAGEGMDWDEDSVRSRAAWRAGSGD